MHAVVEGRKTVNKAYIKQWFFIILLYESTDITEESQLIIQ